MSEAATVETGLTCALFAIVCVMCVLGWTSFLQVRHQPEPQEIAHKEKGKSKQKFAAEKGATRRDMAYDHLLETGLIYEGKIADITHLTPTVRQMTFHFGPKNAIQSGVFVTESPVELALYDSLVVLSDGIFTVLI